ncbi:MAG TPA: hypothetical protein VHI78_11150 [Bacteroidales bacterium]|jgi:hypothetical protein|nr:hypothetical protein [Bacteroidales bacterium]
MPLLKQFGMEVQEKNLKDRVRENTSEQRNEKPDKKVFNRINEYKELSRNEISGRLDELRREWDIERAFEVNAASFALAGLFLGSFFNRKWLILPAVITGFLLQHGTQGWSTPFPVLRALGFRTRQEIDEEIYAMKVLRGDFDNITSASSASKIIKKFRK